MLAIFSHWVFFSISFSTIRIFWIRSEYCVFWRSTQYALQTVQSLDSSCTVQLYLLQLSTYSEFFTLNFSLITPMVGSSTSIHCSEEPHPTANRFEKVSNVSVVQQKPLSAHVCLLNIVDKGRQGWQGCQAWQGCHSWPNLRLLLKPLYSFAYER